MAAKTSPKKTAKKATPAKAQQHPDVGPSKMRVEYREIGEMRKWPHNPKEHDLQALRESMELNGYVDPCVIDERSGKMVSGHGRLELLELMWAKGEKAPERIMVKAGRWFVPVLRGIPFKDEAAAEKYLLAANRITELGGWNPKFLTEILSAYKEPAAFLGTGFSTEDVAKFLTMIKGDRIEKNTDERKEVFDNATIKQIVLYFPTAQFESVIASLTKIMEAREDLNSHTAIFVEMLDAYLASGRWRKAS